MLKSIVVVHGWHKNVTSRDSIDFDWLVDAG